MTSKVSKVETGLVQLEEFAREVERRRAGLGEIEMPRNSGERRTSSKRSLVKAIEDAGGAW